MARLAETAASYAAAATGPGTQAAYRSAWKAYGAWCQGIGRDPLCGDAELLALYLTRRAEDGLAVSSLQVARAAIRAAHRLAGVALDLSNPTLALVMQGITRTHGLRPRRQAAAAVPELLRRLLAGLDGLGPARIARHRAMLLIGFGAALRRSELVALRLADIRVVEGRGLMVTIRRSKTDQQARGREIAVWANIADPTFCPLIAFERWMAFRRTAPDISPAHSHAHSHAKSRASGPGMPGDGGDPRWQPGERPLFCAVSAADRLNGSAMADKVVGRLLKQAASRAGLDPTAFSGHSLRRGLLSEAGNLQLPLADVMRQSRHRSVATALTYLEAGDAWRNNITQGVFGDRT